MINNKKVNPVVIQRFTRCRKLNVSIVFIRQPHFNVPKDVRLNFPHFFVLKFLNKRELQQVAFNLSSDIGCNSFMIIYTTEPYSFLVKIQLYH